MGSHTRRLKRPKLPTWWPLLLARFDRIETLIREQTQREEGHFVAFIDDLEAAVQRETTVDNSIIALLSQISQALKDAGVDPARQAAVLAALQAEADRITSAVTANTPAAP